ncbi:hypothetical protein [Winogradskyella schleiferi]|uniref:hypothetical protein n=1 Tax=Winogradskyella schleiferi TaxID=2686078 RepID=UPI001E377853|nr:hypothetical protein [Winogradskyella schleiferi]
MKTFNIMKKSIAIAIIIISVGCGSDSSEDTVFIPAFNATWPVLGEDDYAIDLQPDNDNRGVESGVFEGAEFNRPNDPNTENFLSGSFNGLSIEFTIERQDGNITYSGTMTPVSNEDHTIIQIALSSSEGELILGFE